MLYSWDVCWTCVTKRYPINLPKHFENKPICWQDQGALQANSTPYLQFIYDSHKWNKPSGILDWNHNQADEIPPSYNISGSRFCIFIELQKFILPLLAARWLNNDKGNLFSTILYETLEYVNHSGSSKWINLLSSESCDHSIPQNLLVRDGRYTPQGLQGGEKIGTPETSAHGRTWTE